MSAMRSAGALILKELAMFDEAARLFESEVQPEICGELNSAIHVWVEENGWKGEFTWGIEGAADETWLAPAEWVITEGAKPNWLAYFSFETDDESTSYSVANLCGVGGSRTGFGFDVHEYKSFGGKAKWKQACNTMAENDRAKIKELGFEHDVDNGRYFMPLKLNMQDVLQAWESEDYELVCSVIASSIGKLVSASQIFNRLMDDAKSKA